MPNSVHDPVYRELITGIIKARIAARLTQQMVADRLARPQSYVAKVENFERRVDIVECLHIAKAIGFDPMALLRRAWKSINGGSLR